MKYICLLNDSNEERLDGNLVLTTLPEVYTTLSEKEIESIKFTDDYVKKFFTTTGFREFISQVRRLHPYTELEYNTIFDADYHNDIQELKKVRTPEDLALLALKDKDQFFKVVSTLVKSYIEPETELMNANNKVANLHLEMSNFMSTQKEQVKHITGLETDLNDVTAKHNSLVNLINYNHGKGINPDNLQGIHERYPNYRGILYIKEVTRVHFVDTLLHYVLEIMKTMYGYPTRFVVIEPPYAFNRFELYNGLKNYSSLTYDDVRMKNIFMAGFHPKLFADILKNPSNLDYLIVLDRSGADKPYVTGPKINTLYTVSDLKDMKLNVTLDKVISYSTETLYVPHLSDFESMTPEDRFVKYSSMEITKEMIKLLEGDGHVAKI